MKMPNLIKHLPGQALFAALLAVAAHADRVELTDGSVIVGKILSADGGKFSVETGFAGKIEIDQAKIKTFSTDEPVNVAVNGGSRMLGVVTSSETAVAVSSENGQLSAPTGKVAAVWRQGADDPETRALKEDISKRTRAWAYEASAAITGRTGNNEKINVLVGAKATLETIQDKLVFELAAERARDNGVDTANRQYGAADYSAFFSPKNIWYARTSLEKDEIKGLDLRSVTAFGIGRKLIKNPQQDLELRAGFSYTYENFVDGTQFDSPGMDFGLIHTYLFKNGKLSNTLTYTPAFRDFANYRIHHESTYEMPLTDVRWKLRVGLTNDYLGTPPEGVERLDTLYFVSLLLNWK